MTNDNIVYVFELLLIESWNIAGTVARFFLEMHVDHITVEIICV